MSAGKNPQPSTKEFAEQLLQQGNNSSDVNAALKFYELALDIYRQEIIGNQKDIANTFRMIGKVHEKQAINFYSQAIKIFKEIDDHQAVEDIFNNTKIREIEDTSLPTSEGGETSPSTIIVDPEKK